MITRNRASIRALTTAGLAATVLAMTLAGCSSNEGTDPTASDALTSKQTKLADCMRDRGFEAQESTADQQRVTMPEGVDQDEYLSAMGECAKKAGMDGQAAKPAQSDDKFFEKLEKEAQCLRENGFPDYPDPDRSGAPNDWKPDDDAAFTAASDKCDEQVGLGGTMRSGQ